MLRSRAKVVDSHGRWPAETIPHRWFPPSGMLRHRLRVARLRCLCTCLAVALIAFGGLMGRARRSDREANHIVSQTTSNQTRGHTLVNDTHIPGVPPRPTWKYPLVGREILRKLEKMQKFYAPEYYDLQANSPPPTSRSGWPPIVTQAPERPSRPSTPHVKAEVTDVICESPAHPRPCLFLLPLRIAEQESKARIHLTQIALLARALNRTLVLPNVGKSKIGACFKWELDTYYNVASLANVIGDSDGDKEWFVELERFRGWIDDRGRDAVKSQLVSVGSTLPAQTTFHAKSVYSNADVSVLAYDTFGAWERDLPGCFSGKFEQLALETMPVFISAPNTTNKDGTVRPVGNSIVDALSTISSRNTTWKGRTDMLLEFDDLDDRQIVLSSSTTQVMVVNWDLRHPIFPTSSKGSLQYSKRMYDLAAKYAPNDPYLVVQWRMESVDPDLLEDCAHALVDTLSRLLHDTVLAANVTSIWFASDYPYPIAKHGSSQRRPGVIEKSGTFRDFELRHEEAMDILRNAFNKQGELSNWMLTDFAEVIASEKNVGIELLHDSGVLAILDKVVSMKADLFVTGASRCSRRSSFTKQVVDARAEEWSRTGDSHLRNVVEIFG